MFCYHYYAEINKINTIEQWDGIVTMDKRIENMEDYSFMKKSLVEYFKEDIDPKTLVIKSFSLLKT